MHTVGVIALWMGAVVTAVGLGVGFYLLFSDQDDPAKRFLAIVPIGFLIVFTGVVTTLLSAPGPKPPR